MITADTHTIFRVTYRCKRIDIGLEIIDLFHHFPYFVQYKRYTIVKKKVTMFNT